MAEDSTYILWDSVPKELWGTPSSKQYKEVRQVGKGTYGDVYLGQNLLTKETVALKKVSWKHADEKHRTRGFPVNALREIRLLKNKCSHPNLVKLLDVAAHVPPVAGNNEATKSKGRKKSGASLWEDDESTEDGFVYLVFEYMDHDLAGLLDMWREKNVVIAVPIVKSLIRQLLEALVYLHARNICHRDLKSSNLLISRDFHLKLADFGLARELNTDGILTTKVVTLWYRAPELLLGDTRYTFGVDVWSVGCILVELMKGSPLFPGKDELDQLRRIFSICGWPSSTEWPEHVELPLARNLQKLDKDMNAAVSAGISVALSVDEYCAKKGIDPDGSYLAARMLALDPTRRYSAHQALSSKFVSDAPHPSQMPPMDAGVSYHEWETRKAKKISAAANKAAGLQDSDNAATVSKSQPSESQSHVSGLSHDGSSTSKPDALPQGEATRPTAEDTRGKRVHEEVGQDDNRPSKRGKRRGSSPRVRGRGRSPPRDSKDRRRRRSRSPRKREKERRKDSEHKSSSSGKRRRSRSPSRKRYRG